MARSTPGPDPPETPPEELAQAYADVLSGRPETDPADGTSPADDAAANSPPPLIRLVEALLFLGGPPLTVDRAAEALRGLTEEQFLQAIEALNRDYRSQGRPYRVRPREQGYELALASRFRFLHDRLYGSPREARISPAALDVLALVAYRQPVTRAEVDSLRGSDSTSLLRLPVRLGLLSVQRGDASGPGVAYGTTKRFLNLFRLRNLDDLPRTEDLQRL